MPKKKLLEKDGKYYRIRRGELVEIPEKWVGQTVYPQKIRKRPSKKGRGRRFRRKVIR
jgi:hypothetical protein